MEQDGEVLESDKAGIITARGTGDGLVIRLDGRVERNNLRDALLEFLHSRRSFLTGNDVAFEWVGQRPGDDFVDELSETLTRDFGVNVRGSRMREVSRGSDSAALASSPAAGAKIMPGPGPKGLSTSGGRSVSLFDGIEALGIQEPRRSSPMEHVEVEERRSAPTVSDSALWDDPDARVVYATLRSGQKIETEHSLVILGDVNSGAELIAGGDIIVLGTLRGVAHAGAYDETGGGRVIVALDFQPTQLRIGMVISRGGGKQAGTGPEIARVEGNLIVVEPYQAKLVASRRRL